MKVFLGGTCNRSTWRDELIAQLSIDHFNPVVEQWSDENYQQELLERQNADFCLFVITPKMEGYFSLAEVVDTSYKRTDSTIFCYLEEDQGQKFSEQQLTMLEAIGQKVVDNGSLWFRSLDQVAEFFHGAGDVSLPSSDRGRYDVFISYGRRHSRELAFKLRQALLDKGYSVWLDKANIAIAVDFQQKIDEGIRRSNHFCYIISPHSVHSEFCAKELAKALELNKRIIPIFHMEMGADHDDISEPIMRLNWMMFDDSRPFLTALEQLVELMEQDKDLVHPHCELLCQEADWRKGLKDPDRLLYGHQITAAKQWLAQTQLHQDLGIVPLPAHCDFINTSQLHSKDGGCDLLILFDIECQSLRRSLEFTLNCAGFDTSRELLNKEHGQVGEERLADKLLLAVNIVLLGPATMLNDDWGQGVLSLIEQQHKRLFWLSSGQQGGVVSEQAAYIPFEGEQGSAKAFAILLSMLLQDKEYFDRRNLYYRRAIGWQKRQTAAFLLLADQIGDYLDFATVAATKDRFGLPEVVAEFAWQSEQHIAKQQHELGVDIFIFADADDVSLAERLALRLREFDKSCRVFLPQGEYQELVIRDQIVDAHTVILIIPRVHNTNIDQALALSDEMGKRVVAVRSQRFEPQLYQAHYPDHFGSAIVLDDQLELTLAELVNAISSNNEYLQSHRFWLQKVRQWQDNDGIDEFLLGKNETIIATDWLESAKLNDSQPPPTQSQQQFIDASIALGQARKERARKGRLRLKRFAILSSCLCCLAIAAGTYATFQKHLAEQATEQAVEAKHEAEQAKAEEEQAKLAALAAKHEAERAKTQEEQAKLAALDAKSEAERAKVEEEQAKLVALGAKQQALNAKVDAEQARDHAKDQENIAIGKEREASRLRAIAEAEALIYQAKFEEDPSQKIRSGIKAYEQLVGNHGSVHNEVLYDLLFDSQKSHFAPLIAHQTRVNWLQYDSHSRLLISGDSDNYLIWWSVKGFEQVELRFSRLLPFKLKQLLIDSRQQRVLLLSEQGLLYQQPLDPEAAPQQLDLSGQVVEQLYVSGDQQIGLQVAQTLHRFERQNHQVGAKVLSLSPQAKLMTVLPQGRLVITKGQQLDIYRLDDSATAELSWWLSMPQVVTQALAIGQNRLLLADIQGMFYHYQQTGESLRQLDLFRAHSHQPVFTALAPLSRIVVSAGLNGDLKLWQYDPQWQGYLHLTRPIQLKLNQWIRSGVVVTVNRRELVFVGTENGSIVRFPVNISDLIPRVKQRLSIGNSVKGNAYETH